MGDTAQELTAAIRNCSARVAVIGAGYVGLPLAVEVARAGFHVTCVDLNMEHVRHLNRGESYIADVSSDALREVVSGIHGRGGRLAATTEYASIDPAPDIVFICVPTPYNAMKIPDLSFIESAAGTLARRLRRGQLIILESTTYPGTTEELVLGILESATGLSTRDDDYFLAFSPERIDPGNHIFTVHTTPKVVGGVTPLASDLAALFFESVAPGTVHKVSSPRVAEMAKLLENSFRAVNIALVNEFALLAERMGLDMWEVITAAATKPFGFMRFNPGPGVGGHCIPVDPHYLSWKAREYGFSTRFIELATEINDAMPAHVIRLVQDALNYGSLSLNGARVLVLGVAFKPNVGDARNSPAERVIELLMARGALVSYCDPYVPTFRVARRPFGNVTLEEEALTLTSEPFSDKLIAGADLVLIVTGHAAFDYHQIVRHARVIVDTVHATGDVADDSGKIWYLGASHPLADTIHGDTRNSASIPNTAVRSAR